MIIRMAEIPLEGRRYAGEEKPSILELDNEKDIHVVGPVCYDVLAQAAPGELIVKGKVRAKVKFCCSRCAEMFEMTVRDDDFVFVQEAKSDASVDLTGEMREAIILAFPNYPVCRNDCKGLCAHCGVSLNREKCGCIGKKENVWAALDGLELK